MKNAAEKAHDAAGVTSDTMTTEQYDRFTESLGRSSVKVSQPRAKPEGQPMSDTDEADTLGISIARPKGARRLAKPGPSDVPPAPRKSINRYRNEERERPLPVTMPLRMRGLRTPPSSRPCGKECPRRANG